MDMKWVVLILFVMNFPLLLQAAGMDYAYGNLSTTWINNDFIDKGSIDFIDGSTIRPVLLNNSNPVNHPAIGCGFYRNRTANSFFFSVFAVQAMSDSTIIRGTPPQVLWTANRANPVKENASLEFTKDGDLVLTDFNGTYIWSSNTSSSSINQMNVSGNGSLQLVMADGDFSSIIWQSWDFPTDIWLPGQRLLSHNRIISSISTSNLRPGSFYLAIEDDNLYAYIESDPPKMYHTVFQQGNRTMQFKTGRLDIVPSFTSRLGTNVKYVPDTGNFQYLRLDPDGHLRVYEWSGGSVSEVDDILTNNLLGSCSYPTVCGNYGICSNGGSCSCPVGKDGDESYFVNTNSSVGCKQATQLSCESLHMHDFIQLDEVSYFSFVTDYSDIDADTCKKFCLNNCSCKAALFQYHFRTSSGNCSLPSEIFSLMATPQGLLPYNYTSFIKVQRSSISSAPPSIAPSPEISVLDPPYRKSRTLVLVLVLVLVGISATAALLFFWIRLRCIRKQKPAEDEEWENSLLHVTNLPKRFTYRDLKTATDNFHKKLGGGGFGSVFEGTLSDGRKVAVKRLDRFGQGRKEFLAEVKTIGSIHHFSLVRLVGFCAENSHKLLIYDYMSNGSLDKWIFNRNLETALEWKIRKKIILSIAKGIAYLHEDCKMRIAHLDIKPQNILLDKELNAKLSDFGLARLIERNQSQITTQMRGTRGYMAPEWLSRKITEKVDVYSFGVVILEIICGRRNLDLNQPEEDDVLLLPIVKQKAEANQLIDLVDKCSEDMQQHAEECVEMMRIGIWCLHNDPNRRPSMSMVVKVLEGGMTMETFYDYRFLAFTVVEAPAEVVMVYSSDPQSASVLSDQDEPTHPIITCFNLSK